MKTTLFSLIIIFQAVTNWGLDPSAQLLIKWKDGPASAAARRANASLGAKSKRDFNALGWQWVELPPNVSLADAAQFYKGTEGVTLVSQTTAAIPVRPISPPTADPPGTLKAAALSNGGFPNDPLARQQWHLAKVHATNAWKISTGSSNVVVAVIDTGVDYNHPDLQENMWRNPGETGLDALGQDKSRNGVDDDQNGVVDDVHGFDAQTGSGDPMDIGFWDTPSRPRSEAIYHGTFIAGLIGAVGNNALGVAGISWSAKIMALRVSGGDDAEDISWQYSDAGIMAALDYAVMMRRRGVNLRVINQSAIWIRDSPALADAHQTAADEGILTVCAAMNEAVNSDLWSGQPAALPGPSILTVAATTESDELTSFSNFGKTSVDLAAPGINLSSTWKSPGYAFGKGGTSYSAPIVSGAAALLLAVKPDLTVEQLRAALLASVDQIPSLRGKLVSNGRLNIDSAIHYLGLENPPAIMVNASPGGQRTATNEPLRLIFNRPMNRSSVESALAISPPLDLTFQWADDNRHLTVEHKTPYNPAVYYTVGILGSAEDQLGGTLDGDFDGVREGSPADDYLYTFRFKVPNDDFADAEVLTGSSGSASGSNRYTFIEWNEPRWFATPMYLYGSSLWYRWTAPGKGWVTFDLGPTAGFDPQLVVSTGERLDQLQGIAWNDQYGARRASRVSFEAESGTVYHITVAGKDEVDPAASGNFTLRWYPTPAPGFTGAQFNPSTAAPGAKISFTGTNFTGATAVLFNGVPASFTNAPTNNLDLRITAIVPPDATSGPITIITPHGSVTSTAVFQTLRPNLVITRGSENQLNLSWSAPTFSLESSADLRSWTKLAASGVTNFTVNPIERHSFFRLRTILP